MGGKGTALASYIQAIHQEIKMDIVGHIESAQREFELGEPVSVILSIRNHGKEQAFLLVPTGRAGGIQFEVKEGTKFVLLDMSREPEPGLQAERRIAPSETLTIPVPLSNSLIIQEPGIYVVECTIPIDVSNKSLRDSGVGRSSKQVTIRSSVRFTVVPKHRT